jgi:hypothetical protein
MPFNVTTGMLYSLHDLMFVKYLECQHRDFHTSECLDVMNPLYCIPLGFRSGWVPHNDHKDRQNGTLTIEGI